MRRALLLALALLAAACVPLQPVDLPPEYTPPPAEHPRWQALEAAAPGEHYVLLNRGPEALEWRLRAIDSATRSIELQTFLWLLDDVGSLVTEHLLRAADRGVRIRILVDDSFLVGQDGVSLHLDEHPNIDYRIYNPFKRESDDMLTRQALNLAEFHRLDHRMHNKSMVVDNRIAIVGGRNLADEYFGLHDEANFRDLELLAWGDLVPRISAAFDSYWNDRWSIPVNRTDHRPATAEELQQARRIAAEAADLHQELEGEALDRAWLDLQSLAHPGNSVLLVDEPPRASPADPTEAPTQVADALIRLFDGAREEIGIVSAYLIPTPELEGAVARAVERGVRVRMLTNSVGSNNHLTAHAAYRNHIETLLVNGAELYEVRTDARDRASYMLTPIGRKILALHAKGLLIDRDRVFIGSANLDPRSLRINTEMGLLVTSPGLNAELRSALQTDFHEANAWNLRLDDRGAVVWVAGDTVLTEEPADSLFMRIEDWFFSLLPMEAEL